jgi:two-component system cell cycle response regulator DivK
MSIHTSPTVLVIDDDPVVRHMFGVALRRAALDVRTAGTADEARAVVREIAADLILLDLHLAGYDGIELVKELVSSLEHTPIVAVSASSELIVRERARNAGCIGFISKPINPETFAAEVKKYLLKPDPAGCVAGSDKELIALQLRRNFLDIALDSLKELAGRSNDSLFSDTLLAEAAHRWVGVSNIGGMPDIQIVACELEALAHGKRIDQISQVRAGLLSVQTQFEEARHSI